MNKFFTSFWAAFLAFFVANIAITILSIFVIVGIVASVGSTETVEVKDGSILKITLEEAITDAPSSSPIDAFDFGTMKLKTSNTILQAITAIDNAQLDSRIKGIYLNIKGDNIGLANIEELRSAIKRFKESGKFVVSYNDVYSQGSYYLSSVADSVFMNPKGGLDWHGMSMNVLFYKGLLDKLGVEVHVLRHGSFKAAVEPFIMEKMSPENSLQMNTLVNSVWGALVSDIAASRKIDSTKLQSYASELAVYSPERSVELGFVDGLIYNDQMTEMLSKLISQDGKKTPTFITLPKYISADSKGSTDFSKNRIEILYANGEIVDGSGDKNNVGGDKIAEKLVKIRKDDKVKAVVLRINSPGGSALASEIMWREIELLRAVKPVIVSMGDVAASGGYYMACPGDMILANRTTITGSIGVFGLMLNAQKGMKDKLGITMDVAKTNPSADMGGIYRSITDTEHAYVMHSIENIYTTFVNRVAAGRNLTFEQVDAIGGGRVWSGADALKIGLIDGFGGIKEAISMAAERAGVSSDFMVHEYVEAADPFEELLLGFMEGVNAHTKNEMGQMFIHYNNIQKLLSNSGVQARMPYILEIK